LSEIAEAFEFFSRSDHVIIHGNMIGKKSFEDIFGSIFSDPDVHFECFADPESFKCRTFDVFYSLTMLSADSTMEKVFFAINLFAHCHSNQYKAIKQPLKMEQIKKLVHVTISTMKIIFDISVLEFSECSLFVTHSLGQFISRNFKPVGTVEEVELGETDIWQWCQDVHFIVEYLDSIENIEITRGGVHRRRTNSRSNYNR
jgi:hypothetical protein